MKENTENRLIPIAFFLLFFVAMAFSIYQQFSKPKITEPIKIQEPVQVEVIASPSATLAISPTPVTIIKYVPGPTGVPQKETTTETKETTVTKETVREVPVTSVQQPTNQPEPTSQPQPTPIRSTICILNICF